MNNLKLLIFLGLLITICGCQNSWTPSETILLGDVTPIGITTIGDEIWISDGNNNRLVQIDRTGKIIGDQIEIERPMHLGAEDEKIYIPSYGIDEILIMDNGTMDTLALQESLDAPAAVDVMGENIAVADFYNHRVLLKSDESWKTLGGKGKEDGEMHYPTDVQFHGDRLYVADAYNNRGQVFDLKGNHLLTFGEDLNFNAATGIYVTDEHIYLSDFENNRVVIFNHEGTVEHILEEGLSNPADITIVDNQLWVLNFAGKYISTYSL